ncbi:MAG: hypothetical protein VW644_12295 [Alphaproteobacteria bacterium]|jgi:hypothetical protein
MTIAFDITIRDRWPLLTDEDIDIAGYDPHLLAVRIVERYGIAKQWADREVAAWQRDRKALRPANAA